MISIQYYLLYIGIKGGVKVHYLYKIGFILICILLLLLVPMFIYLKEMAILVAINTGVIGTILIIVYFLLAIIYIRFGKKLFLYLFVVVIATPTTWFLYKEWNEKREYEQWRDFSNAVPISVNRELTENDIPIDTLKWAKYSFKIPYNGDIVAGSNHFQVELGLTIFNSEKEPVGYLTDDGKGIIVENVKIGDTYYLLIDTIENRPYVVNLYLKQK